MHTCPTCYKRPVAIVRINGVLIKTEVCHQCMAEYLLTKGSK
jgi:hypothetical protein